MKLPVPRRNSVLNADGTALRIGSEVCFEGQTGGGKLRAGSVRLIGKHHLD